MSLPSNIEDGTGSEYLAKVTESHQLVVGNVEFDRVYTATVAVANTTYTLVPPEPDKNFIIRAVLITAKKDITQDVVIDLYEASSENSLVISDPTFTIEMLKSTDRDFIGLNLKASKGTWLTVKADDRTVLVTVMGYFI